MANSKDLSVVLRVFAKPVYQVATGAPVNLASTGISLAAALLSRNKEFVGTPIPAMWAKLSLPLVSSLALNPISYISPMFIGIGSEMETGRQVRGAAKVVGEIFGIIPFIGGIIKGMIGSLFGKIPESPYYYYDPATRGISQGIQKGEPQDRFASAYTDWNNVYSTLEARLAKEYETKFGSSEGASEEARRMISGTSEKGRELEAFLNPTEKRILANYNALFNTAANPLLGGPSPHMVSLASQGS